MTIDDLKARNLILLECISGSKAYGTDLPASDTDIKGVFVLPEEDYYGLEYTGQVNDASNDVVYYELKRFIELLCRNNPNLLELLSSPADCVRYRHPVLDRVRPELFLSKRCQDTFAGYALTQVRKARGLNKKMLNPVEPRRKDVLDFCYVTVGGGSVPAREWLEARGRRQEHCGLVNLAHLKNVYALYYDQMAGSPDGERRQGYHGIFRKADSNDVALSSVSKGSTPEGYLYFNREGYSSYCKEYKEYWDWVALRNEERYRNTLQHGKNYDAKNMMHTLRLLDMAAEIATEGRVIVRRPDRDFLLAVRRGDFSYEALLEIAETRIARMDDLYRNSSLPDAPDYPSINQLLVEIRRELYRRV